MSVPSPAPLPLRTRFQAVLLALGALLVVAEGGPASAQIPEAPAEDPEGVVIDSVAVAGNRHIAEAALIGTIGIRPGDRVSYLEIQAAERRLWQTGRFDDIRVTARGGIAGEPVVLTFHVVEHPILRGIRFQGLEHVSADEMRDSLSLSPGDPYSPQRVARVEHLIRTRLADEGIPFARVEAQRAPWDEDGSEIELIIDVEEGHRVTVADIRFRGNEAFRDSELRQAMSTRPEGFWWFRSGIFHEETLEEDLARSLPDFYASNGFLDFRVLGDTLIIDENTGKARLEVDVEEGPQYRIASFSVEGNRRFPTEDVERFYRQEEGGLLRTLGLRRDRSLDEGSPVFDQTAFYDAAQAVEQVYRNEGHLYARVFPIIERRPPESESEGPTVDVTFEIEEGQPAYVRRIHIEGNEFTHDRVIREQIALLPGDVYSEDRLMRSYQSISGLGFFETPLPFPELDPDEETGDLDITFHVEERQTGSINFGTTMGGATGVSGFIGYEQPNLFGQAKSGSFRWDFGRFQNNFQVQYSDPALFHSRVSGTVSLFHSRDRFFRFASGERRWRGFSTRFGVPVPGSRFTRFFVGYSLTETDHRLQSGAEDTSLFGRPSGVQSEVSLGLRRRTLDHPIFPTMGSEMSWNAGVSGGILGGDGDFSKHTWEAQWWVPVGRLGGEQPGSRPVMTALGLQVKAGTIFGDAGRFPFERFWMGGVQFGEELRGYEETTITPEGYFPRGSGQVREIDRLGDTFLRISAEYAVRFTDNISASAFYEAGNVWRHPRDVDPSRMFRGAGIGLDLVTPFGPLGLDYAYGFDRDVPGWQLHFRMGGQQF